MRGDVYQVALISLGVAATAMFGVFFYRELYPEYRIYQNAYVELEDFRSTYTHQPPPAFKSGVKQIVLEQKGQGPVDLDRCTSCHVALQFQHFSPTQVVRDVNGNVLLDAEGIPQKEPNPNYIWAKLEALDPEKAQQLKIAHVGEHEYAMEKVLQAHPLIGSETRPFEFHPIDEYGCVSCHSGNGRGLTTEKAHGPVFDGAYEAEDIGPVPTFTEPDLENDPQFAKIFNHKPGHELLFQTTPILVGGLMDAKCVQCHTTPKQTKKAASLEQSYSHDVNALIHLLQLRSQVQTLGVAETVKQLHLKADDDHVSAKERVLLENQALFLTAMVGGSDGLRPQNDQPALDVAVQKLDAVIREYVGANELDKIPTSPTAIQQFVEEHAGDKGLIFEKAAALTGEPKTLTPTYQEGERLFISQGCYPCHRIAGFSRGGVGPDLSEEGKSYPWFIKQSIVWPQADLKTSTMPNYHLDHQELEALVTFLLAQKGRKANVSEVDYKTSLAEWEAGAKKPWEQPVSPADTHQLDYAMTVFATEGCAACHRLKGFESNVGFKNKEDAAWFREIIPEMISSRDLVDAIEKNQVEIDARILNNVREHALLDQIEEKFPGNTESFYSNFAYAKRAKKDSAWKERVDRVLMMFVQEYGLGRLVGPRPNWSGIYRTDEWLMEHFRKPSTLVARSIMPVFPFDQTKFYALTHMLDALAVKNRDENRKVWEATGFNPEKAYEIYCSQCHGDHRVGNGPVSEWIYPVPKNLRNADFMRNLTPERARDSIVHGIKGGPMPPWGEAPKKAMTDGQPVLTEVEIDRLVDWLYSGLPGGNVPTPKWNYGPEDAAKDLQHEGVSLSSQLFDEAHNDPDRPDKEKYFIQKKYATPENLAAGQAFFELNCAVCHGREGDGAGARAGVMIDAKPRMLTNLDYLDSRDDMHLLRAIKFGVPGTSMQPWGDQTTTLQRLQLVLFIRSLSQDQEKRNQLYKTLYQGFDEANITIEQARIAAFKTIYETSEELRRVSEQEKRASQTGSPEEAAALYQKKLTLSRELKEKEKVDQVYLDLKQQIAAEKAIYEEIGLDLINSPDFLRVIHGNLYTFRDGKLTFKKDVPAIDSFVTALEGQIEADEKEKLLLSGRIPSVETADQIKQINMTIDTLKKTKRSLISGLEEIKRLQDRQAELVDTLK